MNTQEQMQQTDKPPNKLADISHASRKKNSIPEVWQKLEAHRAAIQEANAKDLAAGKEAGLAAAMLDRLELTMAVQIHDQRCMMLLS